MSLDLQFRLVNWAVLPFWFLMVFAPRWWLTTRVMGTLLGPAMFAVLYTILIVPHLGRFSVLILEPPELNMIAELLGQRDVAVVAWIHYLAFDLFVGRWEYLDSQDQRLSAWLVGPALGLTLMLRPLGLLVYLGIRHLAPPVTHPERPEGLISTNTAVG